jgi:hypothetical protein
MIEDLDETNSAGKITVLKTAVITALITALLMVMAMEVTPKIWNLLTAHGLL